MLVEKIGASGFKPDLVIGITMGGLVPLALVAKKLGVKDVDTISVFSYDKDQQKELKILRLPRINGRGKKILVVDEIADTGRTLKAIMETAENQWGADELKVATFVVKKETSAIIPDFYAIEGGGEFIIFPWERDEFPEHFR